MKKEDRKYWPTHEFIQRLITQTGFNPGKMINPYEVELLNFDSNQIHLKSGQRISFTGISEEEIIAMLKEREAGV